MPKSRYAAEGELSLVPVLLVLLVVLCLYVFDVSLIDLVVSAGQYLPR
jgi:hypothetical protein